MILIRFVIVLLCLFLEKNAISGEAFDYSGYFNIGLVRSVAIKENPGNKFEISIIKNHVCESFKRCTAIGVNGNLNKSRFLEEVIYALSTPCEYSMKNSVLIKNPKLSEAKIIKTLDGEAVFCQNKYNNESIVIVISDKSNKYSESPITIVIVRKY